VENFPDDPRLGRKLLLVGAGLLGVFWFLAHSSQWMDSTFPLQILALFAGIVCMVLGLFVFFRRAVWRNQERQGSGLLSLELSQPWNKSEDFCVHVDDDVSEFCVAGDGDEEEAAPRKL
jgi:hypothetical protein